MKAEGSSAEPERRLPVIAMLGREVNIKSDLSILFLLENNHLY
jgi:hypothetical protein